MYQIVNMCLQTAGAARVEALTARGTERTCAAGAETTAAERTDVSPHRTRDDCTSQCHVHLTPVLSNSSHLKLLSLNVM